MNEARKMFNPNKYARAFPSGPAFEYIRTSSPSDGRENKILIKSRGRGYKANFPNIDIVPDGEGGSPQAAIFDLMANVNILLAQCLYYLESEVDFVNINGQDVMLTNEELMEED